MWSTVYHLPTDFFTADELPFQQKTLFCRGFWNSLMLKSIMAMATFLASMFTLFTFMMSITTDQLANQLDVDEAGELNVSFVFPWRVLLPLSPLVFAVVALQVVLEHPSRLLIYYRLWEQKIVINFKERNMKDKSTCKKVAVISVAIAGYLLYGWFSDGVSEKGAYTFVVLQSLGAMGATVYEMLSVESCLQGINGALKHYHHYQGNDNEKNEANPLSYRDRAAKAVEQVQFVPEWRVKYDIMAIQAYAKNLNKKLSEAKSMYDNDPYKAAAVAACEEEDNWLKMLGMWIGRLGNSKETYKTRWAGKSSFNYVVYSTSFMMSTYHDPLWHATGSFKGTCNVTGSTKAFQRFIFITVAAIIGLEVFGYITAARRTS